MKRKFLIQVIEMSGQHSYTDVGRINIVEGTLEDAIQVYEKIRDNFLIELAKSEIEFEDGDEVNWDEVDDMDYVREMLLGVFDDADYEDTNKDEDDKVNIHYSLMGDDIYTIILREI